jgi:hypothetical protein
MGMLASTSRRETDAFLSEDCFLPEMSVRWYAGVRSKSLDDAARTWQISKYGIQVHQDIKPEAR